MKPAIGYIRVSTARQGRSGLGLEAQQAALAKFCDAEAFRLVETFTETESGADDDRPQLSDAIERARKAKVPIIVAKLDRLSRDVHYISGLIDAFHGDRHIPVRRGRSRYGVKPLYIRFCFPDAAIADAFRNRFGGECLTHTPEKSARVIKESRRQKQQFRALQYGRRP
jgi:resolvase-like protein